MGNDIQVTVTHEDFENIKEVDKKLNLIYRVVSAQQTHCRETVKILSDRITDLNVPKINKVKVGGAVGGAGIIGVFIDRIIHYFMQ